MTWLSRPWSLVWNWTLDGFAKLLSDSRSTGNMLNQMAQYTRVVGHESATQDATPPVVMS